MSNDIRRNIKSVNQINSNRLNTIRFIDDFLWIGCDGDRIFRPNDVDDKSCLIYHSISFKDTYQGKLNNCWFIASITCLIKFPLLLFKILDFRQTINPIDETYTGAINLNFRIKGLWTRVTIDDRLLYNANNTLEHCHNKKFPRELWMAYIEKAYAYIHKKSYSTYSLRGGTLYEALDLFGLDVIIDTNLKDISKLGCESLLRQISNNKNIGALTGIYGDGETVLKNGLVSGHAYTILYVDYNNRILIKNPWASLEFDDGVANPIDLKLSCCVDEMGDGIFWISFEIFYKFFNHICVFSSSDSVINIMCNPSILHFRYIDYEGVCQPLYKESVNQFFIIVEESQEILFRIYKLGQEIFNTTKVFENTMCTVFKLVFRTHGSDENLMLKISKIKNNSIAYFIGD